MSNPTGNALAAAGSGAIAAQKQTATKEESEAVIAATITKRLLKQHLKAVSEQAQEHV